MWQHLFRMSPPEGGVHEQAMHAWIPAFAGMTERAGCEVDKERQVAKKVAAIICAAGPGTRFGGKRKKQFTDVGGRAVFMRSIELFSGRDDVKQVLQTLPQILTRLRAISPLAKKQAPGHR